VTDRTPFPWTEGENESLRVAWLDPAWTHGEIATALRRPASSIRGQARRLNLGTRPKSKTRERWVPWTAEDLAGLRQMWADGVRVVDIAARLGRTRAAVEQKTRIEELPRRGFIPRRSRAQITAAHVAELARRGINVSNLRR
jgi:hypothetical protein